jgi:aerobic carbon-monoxide dehydrogenase medium subunit
MSHREELFDEVAAVINIKNLGLNFIRKDAGFLKIGATTTLTQIMNSDLVNQGAWKGISDTIKDIRINEIRNMGTIGGEVCICAELDLPTTLMALDAQVVIVNAKGEKAVSLKDFYQGYLKSVLNIGEIVCEVRVPELPANTGTGFYKFERIAVDMPIVNAAACITLGKDNRCKKVKIVVGAATAMPVRAESAEKLLINKSVDEKLIQEAAEATADIQCIGDIRASAELRSIWVNCAVEKALKKAWNQAQGGN